MQLIEQLARQQAEVFAQQQATVSALERSLRDREQEVATLRKRVEDVQKGVESRVTEERKRNTATLKANEEKWERTLKQLRVG